MWGGGYVLSRFCWLSCKVLEHIGKNLDRRCPSTKANDCWYSSWEPRSHGCSGGLPALLWWQTYHKHRQMSRSRFVATWWRGSWPGFSAWTPPRYPAGCLLRRRRGLNGKSYKGKRRGTSLFFAPWWVGFSLESLTKYDATYILTTHIFKMRSAKFSHTSRIRRLPFYSESTAVPDVLLGGMYLSSGALILWSTQPGCMRGSLRMFVGDRSFLVGSETLSHSSLQQYMMRPPFLKYNAWDIENQTPYSSQCQGRFGGSIPYHRNTSSLH